MEKKFSEDFYEKFNAAGYQTGDEITMVDKYLIMYALANSNVDLTMNNYEWNFNGKKLKKISKEFFDEYFKLYDVKFFDDETAGKIRIHDAFDLLTPDKINEFKKYSKMINPIDLPINESKVTGVTGIFLDKEYYFTGIDLKELNKKLVIPGYIHEVTHTQLLTQKGSVTNYKNNEVLPIFLELLATTKLDNGILLNDMMKIRLIDVLECIVVLHENQKVPDELLKASSYLESALNAINLYDLYCSSKGTIQKELLDGIQSVFDGNKTIEDILNYYFIDYEEGSLFKDYLFTKYIK